MKSGEELSSSKCLNHIAPALSPSAPEATLPATNLAPHEPARLSESEHALLKLISD